MRHFTALDVVVLLAYLAATTLLGVWLGRGQKSARDYFVADKAIPWWAILFSVVATETSALTFISIPGVAYLGNLTFIQVALGYLVGRIVVSYTLLPRYYEGELVTAYSLLEKRFGIGTRRFASVTFMVTRAFGDSVRVFATAIPIALILGPQVPREYVGPVSILLLGVFTIIYTYHGGMRAVVWTDVVQTTVYLLGALAAAWLIGRGVQGGWGEILAGASANGKLRLFDLSLGLDKPYTLAAGLIGGAFLSMASHGADQLIVQRLLAAPSVKGARKALIGSGVAVILQFLLFLLIGVGLYAYYQARHFASPDAIFPSFIVDVMPAGLTGLVVAAILAAAMSTVSGSLNSLSAATTHDIYLPITGRNADDPRVLKIGKIFTLFWAVILIGGALLYHQEGTPVVVVALSIASFTYGGLLGGFGLALLWPRAIQRDAITGMAIGIFAMTLVVFAKPITAAYPSLTPILGPFASIAWPWYVLIGTVITIAAGVLSSYTHPAPEVVPELAEELS
ncbi:MAG TPA: sodium:solute symporter [Gemmatimonadaceae bacterium]|jgi:SSS family transporter|nr:sodium:solute symporter [Gemmatimonadaceae bacterium]